MPTSESKRKRNFQSI